MCFFFSSRSLHPVGNYIILAITDPQQTDGMNEEIVCKKGRVERGETVLSF